VGVLPAYASRDDALPLPCSFYKELLRSTPSVYKRNALLKERYLKSFLPKVKKNDKIIGNTKCKCYVCIESSSLMYKQDNNLINQSNARASETALLQKSCNREAIIV
jgi:hypothetical protein